MYTALTSDLGKVVALPQSSAIFYFQFYVMELQVVILGGDVFPSHANLLYMESSTKHISVNSLMLVLLSFPVAGNGRQAKTIKFLVFWGLKIVMVSRVKPC